MRPRLTGHDFQTTVEWIRARWPNSRTWSQDPEVLYPDFAHSVTLPALEEACRRWFAAGRDRAPSPSRLLALTKDVMRELASDPRHCLHDTFGIEDLGNGYVELTCANRACRHVWAGLADQYRTVGERAR